MENDISDDIASKELNKNRKNETLEDMIESYNEEY